MHVLSFVGERKVVGFLCFSPSLPFSEKERLQEDMLGENIKILVNL